MGIQRVRADIRGPSGVDLSSSELVALSDHPMCIGVKVRRVCIRRLMIGPVDMRHRWQRSATGYPYEYRQVPSETSDLPRPIYHIRGLPGGLTSPNFAHATRSSKVEQIDESASRLAPVADSHIHSGRSDDSRPQWVGRSDSKRLTLCSFISGFATLFPKLSQKLYQLSLAGLAGDAEALTAAVELQGKGWVSSSLGC